MKILSYISQYKFQESSRYLQKNGLKKKVHFMHVYEELGSAHPEMLKLFDLSSVRVPP